MTSVGRAALALLVWSVAAAACGRVDFDALVARDAPADVAAKCAVDAAPVSGLLGWWVLDASSGTIADDSAGSDNGTLGGTNPPTWTDGLLPDGATGDALAFQATNSYVLLTNSSNLYNLPQFSIVAWIRPTSVTADGNAHCIVDRGNAPPDSGWAFQISQGNDGDLELFIGYTSDFLQQYSVGGVLAVNTWARVVATWDGTAVASHVHFYVDSAEVTYGNSTNPTGARADDSQNGAGIGCLDGSGGSLGGEMYDLRIYDRALSAGEITCL
jgi:hypothetical protein